MHPSQAHRRSDVQGLRAVAVLAVIAFHLGSPLRFGYLGVDVFLVISGYVICASLLREFARTRRIRLGAFYLRRVKRLFVPLLAAVGVSVLLFALVGPFASQRLVSNQTLAALGAFANLHFFVESGGYFTPALGSSFLLHTWSLSLEEQFYLVFPVGLLLLSRGCARVAPSRRFEAVACVLVFVGLANLAAVALFLDRFPGDVQFVNGTALSLGQHITLDSQGFAFFMPFTRGWQFLAGAAVAAVTLEWRTSGPGRAGTTLVLRVASYITLASLAAFFVWSTQESDRFLSVGRLGTTVLTATLIGLGTRRLNAWVLESPLMQAIGDRSYSLYLWHFPFLLFAELLPGRSPWATAVALGVSVLAAELSFRLIERPLQLMPAERFLPRAGRPLAGGLVVALLLVLVTRAGALERVAERSGRYAPTAPPQVSWEIENEFCETGLVEGYVCRSRPDGADVVLVGDSHAMALAPGLQAAAERSGRSWSVLAKPRCSFALFPQDDSCETWLSSALAQIDALAPRMVMVFQCARVRVGCPELPMTADAQMEWVLGVREAVLRLRREGIAVLLLADTPVVDPADVSQSFLFAGSNARVRTPDDLAIQRSEVLALVQEHIVDQGLVLQHLDLADGLCDPGSCRYESVSGEPLWFNADHLSYAGALDRSDLLSRALAEFAR